MSRIWVFQGFGLGFRSRIQGWWSPEVLSISLTKYYTLSCGGHYQRIFNSCSCYHRLSFSNWQGGGGVGFNPPGGSANSTLFRVDVGAFIFLE